MITNILEDLCKKFDVRSADMQTGRDNKKYRSIQIREDDFLLGYENDDDFETVGLLTQYASYNLSADATRLGEDFQLELRFDYGIREFLSFLDETEIPGTLVERLRESVKDKKVKSGSGRDSQLIILCYEKEKEQLVEFMYGFVMYAYKETRRKKELEKKSKPALVSDPFHPTRKKIKKKTPEPDRREGLPYKLSEE